MPNFTQYGVEVDVDMDIDVNEFISECSPAEITKLIEALIKDNYLTVSSFSKIGSMSVNEADFAQKLNELSLKYYSMNNEDIEKIEELHKKYC